MDSNLPLCEPSRQDVDDQSLDNPIQPPRAGTFAHPRTTRSDHWCNIQANVSRWCLAIVY